MSSSTFYSVLGISYAPPILYKVGSGHSVELLLNGYDASGVPLVAEITQLPSRGKLHDLTSNYARYGQRQQLYKLAHVESKPYQLPLISRNRVFYRAPSTIFPAGEEWDQMKYVMKREDGTASSEGIIRIVPSEMNELVIRSSDFSLSHEGWTITDNGATSQTPVHETSSYGALMNRFIHSTDAALNIDKNGKDTKQWRFTAPSKFLGNQVAAYNGWLKFTLGAFAGDFQRKDSELHLVVLECRTCALGQGMRFAKKVGDIQFDGEPTAVSLSLHESGWLKDPKNSLSPWTVPTKCQMVEILDNLSAIHILGDQTRWYESVGLDNVRLVAPSAGPKSSVPIDCLCTTPGTSC